MQLSAVEELARSLESLQHCQRVLDKDIKPHFKVQQARFPVDSHHKLWFTVIHRFIIMILQRTDNQNTPF